MSSSANIDSFNWTTDSFLNVDYNWDNTIGETCIIAIPNHAASQEKAQNALDSCIYVGQPNPRIYLGYNGTDKRTIYTPDRLKTTNSVLTSYNGDFVHRQSDANLINVMSWIKVLDSALSVTEVACALSHISLWVHCININKPIVIMEHDAYMIRPFERMTYTNSIEYLGHDSELSSLLNDAKVDTYIELIQYYKETGKYPEKVLRLPVTMVINYNFLFSHGLHAYAIDPFMARRLFAKVLTEGLTNAIDVVVEVTDFELVQTAVYAILGADAEKSTISPNNKISERKNTYSVPGVSQ